MKIKKIFLTLAPVAMFLVACGEEESKNELSGYRYGVFILNEGSYLSNNGSVSYFNPDSATLVNNLFEIINGRPLGDVVQSMGFAGDKAYIVVNGSGKVEIVDRETFETETEPILASYPRYFLAVDSQKGYLTSGNMQGYVYVIDLENDRIRDSIQVGFGPENMVKLGNYIYVANSGGWGLDSTLSIIDTGNDRVAGTLAVGDVPSDMALDNDNDLWVYCKGYAMYSSNPPYDLISETPSRLVEINPVTHTILWEGIVGSAGDYAGTLPKLAVGSDGAVLFFLRPDGVYRIDAGNPSLPGERVLEGSFYGLEVNPLTGDLYVFQSSFTGNGTMFIVDPVTGDSESFTVGIGPSGAVFNLK
jgi:YVTN family beta-propeller protein